MKVPISPDVIDLGPELFASTDRRVINYKGNNYYLSCDSPVYDKPEGGGTFCIKPIHHSHYEHEDFEGRTKIDGFRTLNLDQAVRAHVTKTLQLTGLDQEEIFNALNALAYAGVKLTVGE
jgi:hypothetical protein